MKRCALLHADRGVTHRNEHEAPARSRYSAGHGFPAYPPPVLPVPPPAIPPSADAPGTHGAAAHTAASPPGQMDPAGRHLTAPPVFAPTANDEFPPYAPRDFDNRLAGSAGGGVACDVPAAEPPARGLQGTRLPLPPLDGGDRARAGAQVILSVVARLPLRAEAVPEGDAR